MRFILLSENIENDIVDLKDYITEEIPRYSTYILKNGKFLDLYDGTHGSFIQYCDEYDIDYKDIIKDSIKLNDGKNPMENMPFAYIELPHSLNYKQYDSLMRWLENLESDSNVEVNTTTGEFKLYSLLKYTSDDIIKRIKRYYTSGNLYEHLKEKK